MSHVVLCSVVIINNKVLYIFSFRYVDGGRPRLVGVSSSCLAAGGAPRWPLCAAGVQSEPRGQRSHSQSHSSRPIRALQPQITLLTLFVSAECVASLPLHPVRWETLRTVNTLIYIRLNFIQKTFTFIFTCLNAHIQQIHLLLFYRPDSIYISLNLSQ